MASARVTVVVAAWVRAAVLCAVAVAVAAGEMQQPGGLEVVMRREHEEEMRGHEEEMMKMGDMMGKLNQCLGDLRKSKIQLEAAAPDLHRLISPQGPTGEDDTRQLQPELKEAGGWGMTKRVNCIHKCIGVDGGDDKNKVQVITDTCKFLGLRGTKSLV